MNIYSSSTQVTHGMDTYFYISKLKGFHLSSLMMSNVMFTTMQRNTLPLVTLYVFKGWIKFCGVVWLAMKQEKF
jgi:hypothetical protein